MTEAVKVLAAEEALEQISNHIDAYLSGGPDLEADDITLAQQLGLNVDSIMRKWAEAKEYLLLEKTKTALPAQKEEKRAEEKIGPATSKRRPVPPDPSEEKAEVSLFLSAAQPEVEPRETTPQEEARPAPSSEAKVMLPAVVPTSLPPATWEDAIEAMNTRHAIIDNVGGKTVIAGWEPSQLDPGRQVVVFQSKESFLLRYSNRYAAMDVADGRGGSQQRLIPLGNWWLGHRLRQQHRGQRSPRSLVPTLRPGHLGN